MIWCVQKTWHQIMYSIKTWGYRCVFCFISMLDAKPDAIPYTMLYAYIYTTM